MILKGSMEINATYIKATLVENDFRTKEIDVKNTWWLRTLWAFHLRDLEVLPVHLSSPFLE